MQVDLLQTKTDTGNLRQTVTHIDELLSELNQEKLKLDTGKMLDPLIPIKYLIENYFSLEELDELAFESGINPEAIAGVTIGERARALVMYADNHGLLPVLLGTCELKRPSIDWPEL